MCNECGEQIEMCEAILQSPRDFRYFIILAMFTMVQPAFLFPPQSPTYVCIFSF